MDTSQSEAIFFSFLALDHALTIFAQRNKFNLLFMRMFDHFLIKIQSNVKFSPLERQLQSAGGRWQAASCKLHVLNAADAAPSKANTCHLDRPNKA